MSLDGFSIAYSIFANIIVLYRCQQWQPFICYGMHDLPFTMSWRAIGRTPLELEITSGSTDMVKVVGKTAISRRLTELTCLKS